VIELPRPFCGQRFTTHYDHGKAYACQTLVLEDSPTSRNWQTRECLRGEVAKLGEKIAKMKQAGDAMAAELRRHCHDLGADRLLSNWEVAS